MGLKQDLLNKVKESYADFNPETDWFYIEFEGAGDSFDSFNDFQIGRSNDRSFEFVGDFDSTENWDLLFKIIDESGVDYNWNDGGTTGKISYQENDTDGVLEVTTTVFLESWGSLEDDKDIE